MKLRFRRMCLRRRRAARRRGRRPSQERPSKLKRRTGCRRRIRCRRPWRTGRRGRESVRRHLHTRSFRPNSWARPSTLRHGARRIADVTYINPGYQPAASRSSAPANCRSWFPTPKRRLDGSRRLYRKYAEKEMKDVKFCLAFIHAPSSFHSRTKKFWCRRHQRHEGRPGTPPWRIS